MTGELPEGLADILGDMMRRADAAMPGIVYSTLDAAHELLKGAERAAETTSDDSLSHVAVEVKAARERTEIARDMARRAVFSQGGAVVPRQT